jgi:hypothetical protein
MIEVSAEAWGADRPDWVEALAREADATSQARVAARLGRSNSVVSQVLRNTYAGSLRNVEELVRGQLMDAHVHCPALGRLRTHECASWRARSGTFQPTNSLRVRMYRACRSCPVKTAAEERSTT